MPSLDRSLSVPSSDVISVIRELPQAPPKIRQKIEALIAQLGSSEYRLREKAMEDLESMDMLALWHIQQAVESSDAEVRLRCRHLLKRISGPSR
jgi:hypothetical protein